MVAAIHELPLPPLPQDEPYWLKRRRMLLPKIVGYFKMNTAKRINQMRETPGTPVWQRGYYEHVLRTPHELEVARRYIAANPANWRHDSEYLTYGDSGRW